MPHSSSAPLSHPETAGILAEHLRLLHLREAREALTVPCAAAALVAAVCTMAFPRTPPDVGWGAAALCLALPARMGLREWCAARRLSGRLIEASTLKVIKSP